MFSLLKLCRVCLRSGLTFENINNEDEDGILLIDKLKVCLPDITQKKSEFFNYICIECCYELRQNYTFVKKYTKNEELLLGYIEKLTQGINSESDENVKQEESDVNDDTWDTVTVTDSLDLDEVPLKDLMHQNYGTTILQPPPDTTAKNVHPFTVQKKKYDQRIQRHINAIRRNRQQSTNSVTVKEKPYVCKICKKSYTTKRYLREHRLTHSSKNPHKCTVCDKVFAKNCQLDLHMIRHTGVKDFKCTVCDKAFVRKSVLKTHMLTHAEEKGYKCSICYMEFTWKASLEKHMYVHSCNKTYKCSICLKSFCHKFILDKHYQTHLRRKYHECTVCKKRFKYKCLVDLHMVAHSTNRPYACEQCEKTFKQKYTLERHMLIHNGIRAYKCEQCSRQFRDQYTLNIHTLTHVKQQIHT